MDIEHRGGSRTAATSKMECFVIIVNVITKLEASGTSYRLARYRRCGEVIILATENIPCKILAKSSFLDAIEGTFVVKTFKNNKWLPYITI